MNVCICVCACKHKIHALVFPSHFLPFVFGCFLVLVFFCVFYFLFFEHSDIIDEHVHPNTTYSQIQEGEMFLKQYMLTK